MAMTANFTCVLPDYDACKYSVNPVLAPAGLPNPAGWGFGFVNPNRAWGEVGGFYRILTDAFRGGRSVREHSVACPCLSKQQTKSFSQFFILLNLSFIELHLLFAYEISEYSRVFLVFCIIERVNIFCPVLCKNLDQRLVMV